MKVTIGMATYDDFDGVWGTLQHMRMCFMDNPQDFEVEYIVVDNNPSKEEGKDLKNWISGLPDVHYVPLAKQSAFKAKNMVFEQATGEIVVVMDCHVSVSFSGLLDAIKYLSNPECSDLVQGPLVYDPGVRGETHFQGIWSNEMYGRWAQAYRFPDGETDVACVRIPTPQGEPQQWRLWNIFHDCQTQPPLEELDGRIIPKDISPANLHDFGLVKTDSVAEVFEIPSMGMGLFACRKEHWEGFNPHVDGFGGEEFYMHEKFRQAGKRAVCLSSFKWFHRFRGKTSKTPFPNTQYNRVRNYMIEWQELGLDTTTMRHHFINERKLPLIQWNTIAQDPINVNKPLGATETVGKCHRTPQEGPPPSTKLSELIPWMEKKPRYLRDHFGAIKRYTEMSKSVTEFSNIRESTLAFAGSLPEDAEFLHSFQTELDPSYNVILKNDPNWKFKLEFAGMEGHNFESGEAVETEIEQCDLLYLDVRSDAGYLSACLNKHGDKVNKFIFIHGTQDYGERGPKVGDNHLPGVRHAIEPWIRKTDWFIVDHVPQQGGMTVLSKVPELKPQEPIRPWTPGYGPGTELKKYLEFFGMKPGANCSCNKFAAHMDRMGPNWCEENIEVIREQLKNNAEKMKKQKAFWLADQSGQITRMIKKCIKRARKTIAKEEAWYYE